jgi:hypothetical protein
MREAIPPLPQYVFIAWCLVKHRDNFTFTFTRRKFQRSQIWRTRGQGMGPTMRKLAVQRDTNPMGEVSAAPSNGETVPTGT